MRQPKTPLPWDHQPSDLCEGILALVDDEMIEVARVDDVYDADYITHAANAYPKLVEALRELMQAFGGVTTHAQQEKWTVAKNLLSKLGEVQ